MTQIDPIDDAIAAEEAALLRAIRDEPGYFTQARSIFGGETGWVNVILMIAQTAMFVAGAYATWRFFGATETLEALRWGLPGAVLLLMALIVKLSLWPVLQTNRVLRALKRLELAIRTRDT